LKTCRHTITVDALFNCLQGRDKDATFLEQEYLDLQVSLETKEAAVLDRHFMPAFVYVKRTDLTWHLASLVVPSRNLLDDLLSAAVRQVFEAVRILDRLIKHLRINACHGHAPALD
jgi:hypothetical protein